MARFYKTQPAAGASRIFGAVAARPRGIRQSLSPWTIEKLGLQNPILEIDDYNVLASFVRESDALLIASDLLSVGYPELGIVELPIPLGIEDDIGWTIVSSASREFSFQARRLVKVITSVIEEPTSHVVAAEPPRSQF
jgi:hypothetical protein